MASTNTVAAVIATHNGVSRGYIFGAIESVLGQTLRPAEIVIVDDGSSDGTAAALEARFGDTIRVLRLQHNVGPSGARNLGVRSVEAPVIAFLDDDDEWLPEKIELQLGFMNERSARLVFSRVQSIDEKSLPRDERRPVYPEACTWPGILFRNPVHSPSSVLLKRDSFLAVGGFPEARRMGEDWVLWARIARLGTLAFMDRALARYRVHAQQAGAGHDGTWIRERTLDAVSDMASDLSPEQRTLVLRSYAYGGSVRALMARQFEAARRLATIANGRIDWPLLVRKCLVGGFAHVTPQLRDALDRRELRRLARAFERLA